MFDVFAKSDTTLTVCMFLPLHHHSGVSEHDSDYINNELQELVEVS